MCSNIIVTGLPGDVRFTKLVTSLRMIFKKAHIKQFWIRDLSDDGQFKQMTVEIPGNADATRALDCLNNVPFKHNMMEFSMRAYISEQSTPFYNENDLEDWDQSNLDRSRLGTRRRPKRNRARSRSPCALSMAMSSSEIDRELDVIRKQRQVIELKTQLLLEQRKLELIQEFGASGQLEFENMRDFEPPRKRRQPEPMPERPRQMSSLPKIPKFPKKPSLPQFFQPCKKLIGQMRPIIERDADRDEVEILTKLIRAAIRKDLALALEDKEYMKQAEIINLYRQRHPQEQDEGFVAKILANIRASYLTEVNVSVKKEKVTENFAKATKNQINEKGEGDAVNEPAKSQEPGNPVAPEVIQPEIDFTADVTVDAVADEIGRVKEEELLADDEPKSADHVGEQ